MAANDVDKMKLAWNRSLYQTDGTEVELFKDIDFIDCKVRVGDIYRNESTGISQTVDLKFISKYKVHHTDGMLVFKLPTSITFDLHISKLAQYFKQVSVGTFKDDKANYLLRLYLFTNVNYVL